MNVIGFCGFSGSGKTTLVEQLIGRLRLAGKRVSVVKHAHHEFDIDRPGKDSWRHRQAGAFEVVIASNRRLAKMREFDVREDPSVHQLIAELSPCDWVLVEGFKRAALPKVEIWRQSTGQPVQYPEDAHVVAIATDSPGQLPRPTTLPLLDLNDPAAITDFLLAGGQRYAYRPPAARQDAAATPVVGVVGVDAVCWAEGMSAALQDLVADEVPVALLVDGRVVTELFATPADLDDLALGYLLGAGLVDTAAGLTGVAVEAGARGVVLRCEVARRSVDASHRGRGSPTSGMGGEAGPRRGAGNEPAPASRDASWSIDPAALGRGMGLLAAGGALRRATGATHAAAWLSFDGEVLVMREDVGRHNALDKLIGAMASSSADPRSGFVAVTSRASHEIVSKVARAGVGLLAVMSAPTALAIRHADAAGLTLVGFARGGHATVYSHCHRVAADGPAGSGELGFARR